MIVLDTNSLIWWVGASNRLSKKAGSAIEKAREEKALYISSISVWEIYTLVKKRKLELDTLLDNWLENIEELSFVHFVPLDNKIAVQSVMLPDFSNSDPADRIIIATAQIMGATLITSDKRILKYKHVQTLKS